MASDLPLPEGVSVLVVRELEQAAYEVWRAHQRAFLPPRDLRRCELALTLLRDVLHSISDRER